MEREREREEKYKLPLCKWRNNNKKAREGGEITGGEITDRQTASSFREPGTVDDEEDRDSDSNCLGIARIAAN